MLDKQAVQVSDCPADDRESEQPSRATSDRPTDRPLLKHRKHYQTPSRRVFDERCGRRSSRLRFLTYLPLAPHLPKHRPPGERGSASWRSRVTQQLYQQVSQRSQFKLSTQARREEGQPGERIRQLLSLPGGLSLLSPPTGSLIHHKLPDCTSRYLRPADRPTCLVGWPNRIPFRLVQSIANQASNQMVNQLINQSVLSIPCSHSITLLLNIELLPSSHLASMPEYTPPSSSSTPLRSSTLSNATCLKARAIGSCSPVRQATTTWRECGLRRAVTWD